MRSLILALVLAVPAGAQASVVTDTFTSYWALGDSLSDNGNLNRIAFGIGTKLAPTSGSVGQGAYYQTGKWWSGLYGRFSNGPTFAEHIASDFSAAGRVTGNFAYGGAEAAEPSSAFDMTPGLAWQQGQLADRKSRFGDRPLVSLLMGANDIFDALGSNDPARQAVSAARAAADAVTGAAQFLSGHGVSDFLIANLPDIGLTPAYSVFQPSLAGIATAASLAFNERLAANVNDLRHAGLNVVELDLFSVIHDMVADPPSYGFGDVKMPCMFQSSGQASSFGQAKQCSAADSRTRLFFDSVHPNYLAHQQVGEMALNALSANLSPMAMMMATTALTPAPVPLPAGAPLILAAIGALALFRRRSA
ncbi:MAG: SGNH/GDSL hydrolase family protein [Paracoccus sp. (in: a-proteobacteria)]|uniref:SGNH/GDSL hydrolase family protein n=1 Tax=Paracoccus sp. TaxID=267 RepID=UPI0026E0CA71|nr:SGNH/GDSL hydrolase family protein [Paracoccus sp. (in: a-proteobacteria)]MDO5613118.1 SGNH/GDSL hydrolase family protein [Paracoccus sp. (in: a-proteobacteria)]